MQDWRAVLIDALQVIAPTSAALFAMLALFTDYKEDGKVTRWGRVAVVGIVVSALCSLMTQWAQGQIDEERSNHAKNAAQTQLNLEDLRFNSELRLIRDQADSLRHLNAESANVRGKLEQSLSALGVVQASAERNLAETQVLQARQDANTGNLLRAMWSDANRIKPSSFYLGVVLTCQHVIGELPTMFREGTIARIGVSKRSPLGGWNKAFNLFYDGLIMGSDAFRLTSLKARTTTRREATDYGDTVHQLIEFDAFESESLDEFARPEGWQGAYVDVVMEGFAPDAVQAAIAAMPNTMRGGKEELAKTYDISDIDDNDHYQVEILPCDAHGALSVNEREIAEFDGKVVQAREWSEDTRGLIVLKFPVVTLRPEAFPTFAVSHR